MDERGWEHTGVPIRFRDEPGRPDFGLPEVGQYTEGSLHEAGYGDTGIAALGDDGVF